MGRTTTVEVTSRVGVSAGVLWERATSVAGINHELGPWLHMTVPRDLRGLTIDTAPLGTELGRSWVLLLRVLPVDYDDLRLVERGPGHRFLERSRLGSMRSWEHERSATSDGTGATITDRLTFEPRKLTGLLPRRLVAAIVRALFRHRHRRLTRYFAV